MGEVPVRVVAEDVGHDDGGLRPQHLRVGYSAGHGIEADPVEDVHVDAVGPDDDHLAVTELLDRSGVVGHDVAELVEDLAEDITQVEGVEGAGGIHVPAFGQAGFHGKVLRIEPDEPFIDLRSHPLLGDPRDGEREDASEHLGLVEVEHPAIQLAFAMAFGVAAPATGQKQKQGGGQK